MSKQKNYNFIQLIALLDKIRKEKYNDTSIEDSVHKLNSTIGQFKDRGFDKQDYLVCIDFILNCLNVFSSRKDFFEKSYYEFRTYIPIEPSDTPDVKTLWSLLLKSRDKPAFVAYLNKALECYKTGKIPKERTKMTPEEKKEKRKEARKARLAALTPEEREEIRIAKKLKRLEKFNAMSEEELQEYKEKKARNRKERRERLKAQKAQEDPQPTYSDEYSEED